MNFVNREWFSIFLTDNEMKNVKRLFVKFGLKHSTFNTACSYPGIQILSIVLLRIDNSESNIVCFIFKNVAVFNIQNIYLFVLKK